MKGGKKNPTKIDLNRLTLTGYSGDAKATIQFNRYCRHRDCQQETASELRWIAGRTWRPMLELLAGLIYGEVEVRCRHVPRDGRTPFYAAADGKETGA